jgi:hypothetical protein
VTTIILKCRNKCWVLCSASLIFFSLQGWAQQSTPTQEELVAYYPKKFISKIDLLAGPSFIYPNKKYDESRVAKFGYSFNLNLVHSISSRFYANLKLGYEQKGWNAIVISPYSVNPPVTQKFINNKSFNYWTASLYPTFRFGGKSKFFIGAGGYFGYLSSLRGKSELYYNGALIYKSKGRSSPPYQYYTEFDIGVMVVMGYDFTFFKKLNSTIQFFDNLGLTDINKPPLSQKRNETYCLLVGIILNRNTDSKP